LQPDNPSAETPDNSDEAVSTAPGAPDVRPREASGHASSQAPSQASSPPLSDDVLFEGRAEYELDVDRMVNEGLGGGRVTLHNGLIGDTTTDGPDFQPISQDESPR
jgi:hypothetical protein